MATAKIIYQGNLRTESEHLKSGNKIISDAPLDNHGKGEAFSPTDLLATSFVSCMMTIMGILAERHGWDLTGMWGEVTKVMAENPRRVSELVVEVYVPSGNLGEDDKKLLERSALACPVAKSLHPDIKQTVSFLYF